MIRLAGLVGLAVAFVTGPAPAAEPETSADPAYWQARYRKLVTEADRLRAKIEVERELYADANRRNYRRGKKRHVHRKAVFAAEAKLAKVEAQLATIEDDARRAGTPAGWLTRIEIELEDEAKRPPVAAGPGDEGRNPLYVETEDGTSLRDVRKAERDAGRNPLHVEAEAEAEAAKAKKP